MTTDEREAAAALVVRTYLAAPNRTIRAVAHRAHVSPSFAAKAIEAYFRERRPAGVYLPPAPRR